MCRCAYPLEILIQFFSWIKALFELRNLTKMKDITETVCQRNLFEAAQRISRNVIVMKDLICGDMHFYKIC